MPTGRNTLVCGGGGDESDESCSGDGKKEPPSSFRDFDWRLMRWADASHVPGARLSGGGAGAG